MLIVAGIGRKVVCRSRICVTDLLPRILVGLQLGKGLFPPFAEALAPVDRRYRRKPRIGQTSHCRTSRLGQLPADSEL
jgi:hypothetical protein